MDTPLLFRPLSLRGVPLRNRIVISPMCQYSAVDGLASDWHLVHLGRFALGGAGTVFVEATAVHPRGRITHGDLGLWSDSQIPPLRRIARFLAEHGAVPAIQLAHAGRKASMQRPWHGNGPIDDTDTARGEDAWPVVAPSALPMDEGWLVPHELSPAEMAELREAWRQAAVRALESGFEIVELHAAHGYLLHEFLSPLSNRRGDAYGGDHAGRMRFPLEVAETLRAVWPQDRPVFVRVSAVDGIEGGWTLEDTVAFARELKARRRCRGLFVGRARGLRDRGARAARPGLPGALRRAHPPRSRAHDHGRRPDRRAAAGRGHPENGPSRPRRHRPRGPVRPELAGSCRAGARSVARSLRVLARAARLVARTPRARIAGAPRQGGGRVRRIDAQTGISAARGASLRAISSMVANTIGGECACSASGRV